MLVIVYYFYLYQYFIGILNKKNKFCIFQAAKHLGQECGATVESVHFGLMKYSLDLWSAKMASDAEIPFACFMAGGKDTGQKINCFKEIFKSVSFTVTFFASHRIPFVEAGKPCYITFCRSSVCRRREGCNLLLVSEGQGRAGHNTSCKVTSATSMMRDRAQY